MADELIWHDGAPPLAGFYIASKHRDAGLVRHYDGEGWSMDVVKLEAFTMANADVLRASPRVPPIPFLDRRIQWLAMTVPIDAPVASVTDGWIDWQGGACPVDSNSIVEIRYRSDGTGRAPAGAMRWTHGPDGGDIVGYRVVGERRTESRHSHYFRSVKGLDQIDVYRVLQLFEVTDPCLQHAIKKLLVPGKRGAGKDVERDVREAIDTLKRWQEMQTEGTDHV